MGMIKRACGKIGMSGKIDKIFMILKTIAGDKVRSEYFYRELRVPSLGLQWLSLAGLLAAYALAPRFTHDISRDFSFCVLGVVSGTLISLSSSDLKILNLGGSLNAIFSCMGFRMMLSASDNVVNWTLPLGVLITLSIAAIASAPVTYVVLILAVWFILGQGGNYEQLMQGSGDWPLLYAVAAVLIGLQLNISFFQLRRTSHVNLRRLKDLAYRDFLTGIPNRRYFIDALHGATEKNQAFSGYLLMFDVDDFKKINDECGHDTGDLVLKAIGKVIADKAADCLHGRLGGEEFAVFLAHQPGQALAHALALADALLSGVRDTPMAGRNVTISVGVAPLHGAQVAASLRSADEALYRAKLAGKNRLALAPELMPAPLD